MRYTKHYLATAAILALGVNIPLFAAHAQDNQGSPFAGVIADDVSYPTGVRLRSTYEEVGGTVEMAVPSTGMTSATAGFASAAAIQSRLPVGFNLGPGKTNRVSGDLPEAAGAARLGAVDAAEARDAPPDKYISLYPIEYQSIPLAKGSDYLAIVSEDGRLLHARERGIPDSVDQTDPTVPPEDAVAAAAEAAGPEFADGRPVATEPTLEIWVSGDRRGHLSWTFTLASESIVEPEVRRYWVAAVGAPQILSSESEVYHTHQGTVTGNYWQESPFGPQLNQPLRHLRVSRAGGGGGMVFTAEDGRYGFSFGGGNATMNALLRGRHARVQNQAGANMQDSNPGTPDEPVNLNFGASNEFTFAQVTAYHWTNIAHDLAQDILDPGDLPQLLARVNINSSCNAFWNGNSINFFRAGGSCPNTAYSDVVLHEYGHGVDARKGGIINGGYSEGFGDALAILGTRQSCLGRDFLGAGTCLRPATDLIMWPPAPGEGVHATGRRYAGFTWELVEQLRNTYSDDGAFSIAARLVLAASLANPSSIPDAVHLSFLADDDDGNLANGTPHFKELANAADSRNIPRPDDPVISTGVVVASAHFPWSAAKKVSSNSNILQAQITLTRPTEVHITANTSARTSASPLALRTGFYTGASPNVMWTNSLRSVSLQHTNQWVNFSSELGIQLPAGTHTIYWKIWVNKEIQLSSGALLVEGLGAAGPLMAMAGTATTEATDGAGLALGGVEVPTIQQVDDSGDDVTRLVQ